MRKLFDLRACAENEPKSPDMPGGSGSPGDSPGEQWMDYFSEWSQWLNDCIVSAPVIGGHPPPKPQATPPTPQFPLPPEPPTLIVEPDKFEDTKGYVWTKTISSKGIDFKLDFFEVPPGLRSFSIRADTPIIIAIRISLNDYSIVTLGPEGIKMQALKRNKVRFANLLSAISNHAGIPNGDLSKIPDDFGDKQRNTKTKNM